MEYSKMTFTSEDEMRRLFVVREKRQCMLSGRPRCAVLICFTGFIGFFAFLFSMPIANAAAAPTASAASAKTLTWKDCVNLAESNSPEIKAARGVLESAQADTRANLGLYFPTLELRGDYSKSQDTQNAIVSGSDGYTVALNLTQNIFNGFGDEAKVARARAVEHAAEAVLQITKAKVSADLKTAFSGLLFAHQTLVLAEDIVKRRKQNLSLVQLRFEGGRENKGSVLLSDANVHEAELERMQAAGNVESAQAILGRVLGLDLPQIAGVTGDFPLNMPPAQVDFERIAADSPTHFQAIQQEDQSRSGITIARSALLPSLGLSASAGKFDKDWFPQNDRWSVGVGITIPLFSGGKDYYGLRAAAAGFYTASANRENTDRQLLVTLKQTYNSYNEAVVRADVDQRFLSAARTRADIGRGKYNNGLLSFDEWDIIENDLINREKSGLSSQSNRVSAEAAWEQAIGKGIIP
jgi:outer membrane protein